MSETIEVGGRAWTLGDAEDVVAWSDGGGLGEMPSPLISESCVLGFYGAGSEWSDLTREHVEALRDFCLPWAEVEAHELVPGDVVRMRSDEWTVIPNVSNGTHRRLVRPGDHTTIPSHHSVLVRRPRRPKLTPADLKAGDRFRVLGAGGAPKPEVWQVSRLTDGDLVVRGYGDVFLMSDLRLTGWVVERVP